MNQNHFLKNYLNVGIQWVTVMKSKQDKPFGTILLDEPVVIWRTSDGNPHAMRDLCIHRGTALSLGWIKDDCLVCPYHAWQYEQ